MKYHAKVQVGLKPGHSDPEGDTTKQLLLELKYPIRSVGVSKVFEITMDAKSLAEAKRLLEEMCRRLLANPVKDDFSVDIREEK